MTTASDRAAILRRAWQVMQNTLDEGSYCSDCELCRRSGGGADEPATRDCALLYQVLADPRDCPAVDLDDIADCLAGERREEAEYARREWRDFEEAEDARREWRDFDCRR